LAGKSIHGERVKEAITSHPTLTNVAIADLLGVDETTVRRVRKKEKLPAPVIEVAAIKEVPVEEKVREDRELYKLRESSKETEARYKHVLKELELAEHKLNVALSIKDDYTPAIIEADPSLGKKSQATAIVQASDWHVGLKIDKRTVNGINEFNPKIAEQRIAAFFRNLLKLVRKERQDVEIKNLVLHLGGDFISNTIHPELMESNYMSPTEETRFAQAHIGGGLKLLAEDGEFERIVLACSTGNHGRTTEKRRISTEASNSFEHLMYWNLADKFTDPVFDWRVPNSYFNYVEIYKQLHRFHHGHSVKFQGGIGGLTVPLIRYIHRANQQIHAVRDYIGHFHQLFNHSLFTVNGSLCGFDGYALSIGASPERPQQAFSLFDSKRGHTISAPILLDT
jgi:hypothetical protein